ncbi:kinase-like protein [Aspergillus japonicus CBS 114.51]|uniref:non-specific serine/threonine protein kinase n=1 Tax=Aspergillus japonicus CBS 114.51 TaxID=1448312 RepID=A0A8T8X6L4_ASPJA|nr:kinase-like protein [Aspergillus japonicus CBS 114.51]RAH83817.1 kinase-like protein [Aspergillus japonicus CBS 114.51]
MDDLYHPEVDVEYLEEYVPGGYHPTLIGDRFGSGRYTVVHKLGFGGYSSIWLARDQQRQRYVSLKILTARASSDSREGDVLEHLMKSDLAHVIPRLLDQFSFHGPNGHHRCLVGEPAGGSIAKAKEDSTNLMFPVDAARSIAAQLLLGLSYLHATGERFGEPFAVPIRRVDGKPGDPHAPPHAIYPMALGMPANELDDPEIIISDYGTSFLVARRPSPTLHTPGPLLPTRRPLQRAHPSAHRGRYLDPRRRLV